MIEFKYSFINDRESILNCLKNNAAASNSYTVIDVGASMNPWDAEVLTATLDLSEGNSATKHFIGNINEESGWREVLDYVDKHGKFSFSVCTHTLEDVAYPKIAMEMLPRVSEAGFIAVPSYYQDLARIEGRWPGYLHHRWMFVPSKTAEVILVPKIPFVGLIEGVPAPGDNFKELQILWKKELPFTILNGDYLGPNVEYVKRIYFDIFGGRE